MRPLRNRDPKSYRLISIRTYESRLWINPSNNTRKLVGGILARYQEIFGIELYAYCVLGNHLHLLARAPKSNMDEFCENVNREIARRVNWKNRRQGKFWGRRYDDLEVLSEDDLLEAFLYVTTNPTKHGLLGDSRDWPGLNSFEHSLSGKDETFSFKQTSGDTKVTVHSLKISSLPQFANLLEGSRAKRLRQLLEARQAQLVKERKGVVLGLASLVKQRTGSAPMFTNKGARPPCYTFSKDLRRKFCDQERLRRVLYSAASVRYRLGLTSHFPPHTFKPPTHRAPRLAPFTLLAPSSLSDAA